MISLNSLITHSIVVPISKVPNNVLQTHLNGNGKDSKPAFRNSMKATPNKSLYYWSISEIFIFLCLQQNDTYLIEDGAHMPVSDFYI